MDLAFIADQLGTFETFGKAFTGLFTGFAEFAANINELVQGEATVNDKTVDLTENTQGVFDSLSSK